MKRNLGIIAAFALVGVIAVAAYVLRPPEEASAPIEAVSVVEPTEVVQAEELAPEPAGEAEPEVEAEPTEATGPAEEAGDSSTGEDAPAPGAGPAVYAISQDESEVRFSINEILRGEPFTAVGVTDQVAGEILFDPAAPLETQVGVILINARTLATDNNFRNRAIQNEILDTGQHEFITFTPKQITGLPDQVALGEPVTFQILGDLTIRDITVEQTFEATVTVVSDTRLEGTASATVLRSDYDLQIPQVQSVAGVDDEVFLEIVFAAVRQD